MHTSSRPTGAIASHRCSPELQCLRWRQRTTTRSSSRYPLKDVLQAELYLAHRGVGAPDLSERRRQSGSGSHTCAGSAEYGVVGDVECFEAERQAVTLEDPKALVGREVP